MEQIFQFDSIKIKAKNGQEYLKTLLLTFDDQQQLNAYTSFTKFEGSVAALVNTPDFMSNLTLKDVTFAGKVGYDTRYSVLLEYLNVDGVPQMCNIIYSKVY